VQRAEQRRAPAGQRPGRGEQLGQPLQRPGEPWLVRLPGLQGRVHLSDMGVRVGGGVCAEPGGGHRAAQIPQHPARVLGGDKSAVLLPGDVLVPGDVVDDAGVLAADVEGHLALPGGILGGHGIGSG